MAYASITCINLILWHACQYYGLVLQTEALRWYKMWLEMKRNGQHIPSSLQESLKKCDKSFYPIIYQVLKLLATAPVTSCEAERTFSAMKLIKNHHRSTMTGARLNALMTLKIHANEEIKIPSIVSLVAKR